MHATVLVLLLQGQQVDGDCFGGCGNAASYFGSVPAAIGSSFCQPLSLARWVAMAMALLVCMWTCFKNAKSTSPRWGLSAALIILVGVLANPRPLFALLGFRWLNSLVGTYFQCF